MTGTTIQRMMRGLAAILLAYALLFQGSALAVQASAHLAMASALPSGLKTLCSGASLAGQAMPDRPDHDPAGQPSCCSWSGVGIVEPFVPPAPPATLVVYRATGDISDPGPVRPVRATPLRAATAQGSRAPPRLVA